MTIRQYLESIGATQNELTAKVVTRMEQAMLFDSDLSEFKPDTVAKIINDATNGIQAANDAANTSIANAKQVKATLDRACALADVQIKDLREQTAGIRDAKISSPETKDAVMAFAATLNATKEIFGPDAMTNDVIIAAINAGSYIAWRGIMGPKEEQPRRRI